uniref:Eukaryotic translation initiation factor 3 subunit C n=1 Tax=Steinernema glaseri TaxID=37863 RepID=A0A1I8AIL4_9BILA
MHGTPMEHTLRRDLETVVDGKLLCLCESLDIRPKTWHGMSRRNDVSAAPMKGLKTLCLCVVSIGITLNGPWITVIRASEALRKTGFFSLCGGVAFHVANFSANCCFQVVIFALRDFSNMSKFFRGAVSSSDSSESEDIEEPVSRPAIRDFAYPSDSDDEGPKRIVVNAKDRKFEELKELIRAARNQKKIKDMSKLLTTFENLCKVFEKTKGVMARQNLPTPRFYIRALAELEDYITEQWEDKEGRKTMSKVNTKGLTTLRQKVRKYNKEMEAALTAYRAEPDPLGYSSGEENVAEADEDESDEESEPEVKAKPVLKKDIKKTFMSESEESDSESEDDADDWGSDEIDSDSSDSDIDLEGKQMEDLRRFFLKKEFKEGGDKDEDKRKKRRDQKEKRKEEKGDKDDDDEDDWTPVQTKEERSRQLFDPKTEITGELVIKKLMEIVANRGRLSNNRKNHVRMLQDLFKIADDHNLGAGILVKILFAIVSALFELKVRMSDSMDFESWMKTFGAIQSLFKMLDENKNVVISIKINEDDENLLNPDEQYRVHGSLPLTVLRLDAELTKIFQNADCHSTEYIDVLKGEKELCALIETAQVFMEERIGEEFFMPDEMWQIYMLRIEHLYYKYAPEENGESDTAMLLLQELCSKVYAFPEAKRERQRAMLCQIYHHALHDRWHRARDLMLMSHLQAIVDHSDVSTQILYNRTICQLGLCAFRHGFIKEAHQGLSEIQNTQRVKELLAQSSLTAPRQAEKTPEQEKLERARQVPYHMHINIELMECVYLICSMLLEIPNLACHEYDTRRRLLSRSFHYQLKFSEKSPLIGPPENTREHVVAASRAMLNGDWEQCVKYIVNEKMNAKVWNLFRNAEKVKEMVVDRIKEETLRTYLLMYSTVYQTVSLETLRQLFELPKEIVHAVISKMIIQEELTATLDEPSDCLMMHRVEPSRMQLLAVHLSEKLSSLAEATEQIVEPRSGRQNYSTGYYMKGQGEDKGRRGNFQDRRGDRYIQDGNRRQQGAWQGQGRRQRAGGRV